MGRYTQQHRPLALSTPLGPDALLLEKLSGTEALSALFSFQLDLLAEEEVSFDELLGQPATVTISLPNQTKRFVQGIVVRLTQGGRVAVADGTSTFIRYRAELVPKLWLLTRRTNSRIFQHLSVRDVVGRLLEEWQIDASFARLLGTYEPSNFCVQYQETDFAFLSRLLEEEGIAYFFTHAEQASTLHLIDNLQQYPGLPAPHTVSYREKEGGLQDAPFIAAWDKTQEVRSYQSTVRDYHFENPTSDMTKTSAASDRIQVGKVSHALDHQYQANGVKMLESYDAEAARAHQFDAIDRQGGQRFPILQKIFPDLERAARIRLERELAQSLRMAGRGDAGNFLPGHLFTLQRHFDSNDSPGGDDAFLLTRVEHQASLGAYTGQDRGAVLYDNRFECIPAKLPYRPPATTPRPRVDGLQTAVVIGPPGKEIHIDMFGRVKVRFHWDRSGADNTDPSCWVRVSQVWAGKGWGAFFWPRVGHEVVVAFENGDPSKPLVVGSVYNYVNQPPHAPLPGNATLAGIKSCIFGKDAASAFNEITFYDAPGMEFVQVHSEKNEISHSEAIKVVSSGGTSFHIHGSI